MASWACGNSAAPGHLDQRCRRAVLFFWLAACSIRHGAAQQAERCRGDERGRAAFSAMVGVMAAALFLVRCGAAGGRALFPARLRRLMELDWEWDPFVVAPLALHVSAFIASAWSRLWRRAGIGRGVARMAGRLLFCRLADAWWRRLVSPLHEYAEHLFTAHMIEHELLMAVAAPLLAVSRPLGTFLTCRSAPALGWRSYLPLGHSAGAMALERV